MWNVRNSPIKVSLNVDIERAFREKLMQLIAIILTIFFFEKLVQYKEETATFKLRTI